MGWCDNRYIDEVSEKHKFDLVIVTVNSLNGKTSTEFADDFYDYNDYGFVKIKTEHFY
ncbi:MAG: TPM domain-containing protein [Clostridia bacterium]|nr:TPM domain-containing protein [Clostridia bacterium]